VTDKVRGVPAWAWLAALVTVSFLFRAWVARGMVAPFIMVDELIYSELAKSFADSGRFLLRDVPTTGYGLLYPVVISPAYALFDSIPQAYAAVKTINAFVMSLAGIPAFLLARRVLPAGWSLLAAVLALGLPSLLYTTTVMTENLFYPLFLFAAWALLRMVERPTWWGAIGLYALVAAAAATRIQAVAIVAAILTAPVLFVLAQRVGLRSLRAYVPLYAIAAGGVVLAVAVEAAREKSPRALLGAYAVVGDQSYDVDRVLHYWLWHLEELDLYIGVVPVAALLVLLALVRSQPRQVQALLAVTVSIVFWVTLVVAAFASQFASNRVQERNMFFVAPLLLVVLLVWARGGAPRPLVATAVAVGVAGLLPLVFPYSRFIETGAISDTLALLPIWTAFGHLLHDSIVWSVAAGVVAMCTVFWLVPARYAIVVPLVVLLYFGLVARPIWKGPHGFQQAGAGALFQGIRGAKRDWIDSALPAGASVAAVWTGHTDRFTINMNEFFNRAVGPIYFTGSPTPGGLPETQVRIRPNDGVVVKPDGSPVTDRYVLLDGTIEPDGTRLGQDPLLGVTLWRLNGPLVSTTRIDGLYPNDTWSGRTVTYRQTHCRPGKVAVRLSSDPSLFPKPQLVTATTTSGGRVADAGIHVPPTGSVVLRIPVTPDANGVCVVRYTVSRTAVPADAIEGNTDRRVLGAHFNGFALEAQ